VNGNNVQSMDNVDDNFDLKEFDREKVLSKLNDAIDYLHNKAMKGRMYPKTDYARIAYFKALAYTCNVFNQISKDGELDELRKDVDDIKESLEELKK